MFSRSSLIEAQQEILSISDWFSGTWYKDGKIIVLFIPFAALARVSR